MSASSSNHWPKHREECVFSMYFVHVQSWQLVQPCFKSRSEGCNGECDEPHEVVPLYCNGKCMVLCGPSTYFDIDAWLTVCEKLSAENKTHPRISCTPVNA
jgi:hypothetical protein